MLKGIITASLIVLGSATITIAGYKSIVLRKDLRKRNNWLVVLGVSFMVTSGAGLYGVVKLAKKAVDKMEEATELVSDEWAEMERKNALAKEDRIAKRTKHIAWLKGMEPDHFQNKVPKAFYSSFGFRDWYRIPIVYPYSFVCIDVVDHGALYNDVNSEDFSVDNHNSISTSLKEIRKFSMNKTHLMGEFESRWDSAEKGFVIFQFSNGMSQEFDSYDEFLPEANKHGFDTLQPMMTLREYWDLF